TGAEEGEARQRWPGGIDPLCAILFQVVVERALLLDPCKLAPVAVDERQLRALMDDLQWSVEAVPDEGGPKYGVALEHLLPRRLEGQDMEVPLDDVNSLVEVDSAFGHVERVEEEARLQRRKGVDIRHRPRQAVQHRLADRRLGEIGRRAGARA